MTPRLLQRLLLLASIATLVVMAGRGPVNAAEVGTVAAVEGLGEIGRGGTWTSAGVGAAIQRGDQLRTGTPGRLRVVFQDDSVLAIGDGSFVTVNEHVFDPDSGKATSLMELLQGKLNAVVSDYYRRQGNSYEIKTVTAVAGVRGTEFSMTYDPDRDLTEVTGISGQVVVHSLIDPTGPGVLVTANEISTVPRGALPSSPRRIDDRIFRQKLDGIEFIGGGRVESFAAFRALGSGSNIPAADRVGAVDSGTGRQGRLVNAQDRRVSCLEGGVACLVQQSPDVVKNLTGRLGISLGQR